MFSDRRVKWALLAGFLAIGIQRLSLRLSQGVGEWAYTDWLIDYSSGFTRRGLSGEGIGALASFLAPETAVFVVWTALFLASIFGLVRLCLRHLDAIDAVTLGALLFLPSLLPFYWLDPGAFGRKEVMGFPILLLHLRLLQSSRPPATRDTAMVLDLPSYLRRAPAISLLCCLHVLCQEAAILLFVPLHVILTWTVLTSAGDARGGVANALASVAIYAPVGLCFLVVLGFGRPDAEAVRSLCQRWESVGALASGACSARRLPGAFFALGWDLREAMRPSLALGWSTLGWWGLAFGVFGAAALRVGSSLSRAIAIEAGREGPAISRHALAYHTARIGLKYLLLPLGLSLPLYWMGWDLGRWFAATSLGFMLVCLSRELQAVELARARTLGFPGERRLCRIGEALAGIEGRRGLNAWVLLVIVCTLRLPHCCIDGEALISRLVRSLLP